MKESVRVAVVMGGYSSEREISLQSGQGAVAALTRLGYDVASLDFDERFVERLRELRPDVVFNALHGAGGEDGIIQGVLEWAGLPYTGSDVSGCALSIDKHLTKKLLSAEGLPTPAWEVFDLSEGALPLLPGSLDFPVVVKPRAEGSSAGVRIVRTPEEWSQAIRESSSACLLVEEYVAGREFTCGVLFDRALPVIGITPSQDGLYSYEAKYAVGESRHEMPARIDADLSRRLQALALAAHSLIGLRDYSRTDFIVGKDGRPYVLEINALPGLTPASLVPEECAAIGISYDALIDQLTNAALRRRKKACV
jgi:D-alanine-D-alanine ligase